MAYTSYSDIELYEKMKCLVLYTLLYPVFSLFWRLSPRSWLLLAFYREGT